MLGTALRVPGGVAQCSRDAQGGIWDVCTGPGAELMIPVDPRAPGGVGQCSRNAQGGILGCLQGQELELMILKGLFQLRTFCDSLSLRSTS